jgi:hypothetical protein
MICSLLYGNAPPHCIFPLDGGGRVGVFSFFVAPDPGMGVGLPGMPVFRRSGFSPEAMPIYHAPALFSKTKNGKGYGSDIFRSGMRRKDSMRKESSRT